MKSREQKAQALNHEATTAVDQKSRACPRRGGLALVGLLIASLLVCASSALAQEEHPLLTTFGTFEVPSGIAADESNGNVFVPNAVEPEPEAEHNVIEIFGPEGGTPAGLTAPFTIGGMTYAPGTPQPVTVDNSPGSPNHGALYAGQNPIPGQGDESKLKKFVVNSGGHYELSQILPFNPNEKQIYGLAVNQAGEVYAANQFTVSLVRFSASGQELERFNLAASTSSPGDLAIDAEGNLYIQSNANSSVWKFPANAQGVVTEKSVPQRIVQEGATGVAVDRTTGVLYVAMGNHVNQYSPRGTLEAEFGEGPLSFTGAIAVNSANSKIYVVDRGNKDVAVFGEAGPLTGEAAGITTESFLARGFAAPEGQKLEECFFEYGTSTAYENKIACAQTPAQIGNGGGRVPVTAEIEGLEIATIYHYRLVTKRAGVVSEGRDESVKTSSPPVIESEFIKAVAANEATLGGLINPEGKATTYFVEYGSTSNYGSKAAVRNVGAGKVGVEVATVLTSLTPTTTYHWRLVAENSIGRAEGADQTFTTTGSAEPTIQCTNQAFRIGPSAALPDCRAYEMVSPVNKNNGDIVSLINLNGALATLDQSSVDGEGLAYSTSQAFAGNEGAPYVNQYISRRGADGWINRGITPSQGISLVNIGNRIDIEYRAFSPDLCSGVLLHATAPPLSPEANESHQALYRRELCNGYGYEAVSNREVPSAEAPEVKGISDDGSCTVSNNGGVIYETCSGKARTVSVLPDGTATNGDVGTSTTGITPRAGTVKNAMSADGTRIYWTHAGALYLRLDATSEQSGVVGEVCTEAGRACTISIPEAPEPAPGGPENRFLTASRSGDVMYFLHGGALYRFDLASDTSTLLAASARNVTLGVSEDGSRLVFASNEDLITGTNAEGATPTPGVANLYLYDANRTAGERFKFIATLTPEDESRGYSSIEVLPHHRVASVSPDGTHVAFTSTARLTGYDNSDANSGEPDYEVFVYDEIANNGEGGIVCVSCNPTGQRPVGRAVTAESGFVSNVWSAAYVPPGETELYSPEVMSENGKRVFFDSFDALVPRDTNGQEDVYEWEAPGEGDCRSGQGNYSASNGGCVSLISSGESPTDSVYVDSDRAGKNVFFTTASSLLPQDPGLIDIYDARVEGGFPLQPPPAAGCEGEACQAPLHPPEDKTPASATYHGPGNLKAAKKCKPAKGKKHQDCSKKQKKKKKSGKKPKKNGRAKHSADGGQKQNSDQGKKSKGAAR